MRVPHARQPGPSGGVGQQHGLAHPCLTGDQQDLARPRDRIYQSAQPGQPGLPANDARGLLGGKFTGTWHLPVLSASAFRQRRPQAKPRPRPEHARGAQSAVSRRIPPLPIWSQSDDWARRYPATSDDRTTDDAVMARKAGTS
jgi:hypothetical protein